MVCFQGGTMVLAYCQSRHGMESTMAKSIALILLLFASQSMAATIFRCVDANGKVTFTQHNCPDNHVLDDVVTARNAKPSGSGPDSVMASPKVMQVQSNTPASGRVSGSKVEAPVVQLEAERNDGVSKGTPLRAAPQQPCTKVVEQRYSYPKITKDGKRVGVSGIRKVVVPC